MNQHITWEGCAAQKMPVENWEWKVNEYLAGFLATKEKKTSQVLSPIIDSMANAKVDILIDERTRQWNHELIEGIFIPEEADLIKTIPLSQQEAEDTLF